MAFDIHVIQVTALQMPLDSHSPRSELYSAHHQLTKNEFCLNFCKESLFHMCVVVYLWDNKGRFMLKMRIFLAWPMHSKCPPATDQ